MSASRRSVLLAIALALAFVLCGELQAQSSETASPASLAPNPLAVQGRQEKPRLFGSPISVGMIESKIEEISTAADLDAAAKSDLEALYRKSLTSLEAATAFAATTAAYAQSLETAPKETDEIRGRLASDPPQPQVEPLPPGLAVKDIENRLAKEQADAAAVEAKLSELEKELEAWFGRPTQTRDRITQAKNALEDLDAEIGRTVPQGESPFLTEARRWVAETRQRELRAEILMLDQDLLSYGARGALLKAHRDESARNLALLQTRQRQLENQLNERRRAEATQARHVAEAARRKSAGKHPLLEQLAEQNASLTDELSELTVALDEIDDKQAEVASKTKRIADELRNTRQRLEISGLTRALGQVLIDRRKKLPDQRAYRREAREREHAIAEATLRQIRYDENLSRLRDLDTFVDALTRDLEEAAPAGLRDGLRELAAQRVGLLHKAAIADDAYLRALGDLDYASTRLKETIEEYDNYLAERLLWVRSSPPASLATLQALPAAIGWLVSPHNWLQVGEVLLYEAASSPVPWLLLLCLSLLLWRSPAIRAAIRATAQPLRRVGTDRIGYTLQAIGLTLLLTVTWPLVLAVLGLLLDSSSKATAFTKAIGQGALAVALGLFSLRAFRSLCVPGGVADQHFHWPGPILRTLRSNFDWAMLILVPTGFVAEAALQHEELSYAGSLGRVALLLILVGLALFTARLIHPKTGVPSRYLAANPDGWVNRLNALWYPLIVATPLVLALLALLGYVYTAGTLLQSLVDELWLILGLTVIHQLMVRWIILTRRRLALRSAIERQTEPSKAAQPVSSTVGSVLQVAEPEVDLAALDERTRKLVNSLVLAAAVVGLWAIYSDVLPALAVFEKIALWSYTGVVNGQEQMIPVTLADIGLILIISVMATVAAKNLPALLEIALLQRISMSSGSRYTVKTLTGYGIVIAAAFMVFSTLGLSWSQVQWLVAALGVGIGFGLQEVVANFICGLIILFERPIRVGDIVSVADTTGIVTKIEIRATTIRNWDKQELLVPNKDLVTGHLLNWTLSDQMNRIVITIGVDYGADIPKALELLREVAEEDERILRDPEPLISFEGFGENALTVILRCYLATLEHRMSVTTGLHLSINEKFQAAGISIAFPQRDVHLSASKPLEVRVNQGNAG